MTAIWAASPVTPAATHRVPVDVSAAGSPSYITGQNIADINTIIGGTVTALGSIGTNTALNLALGGYFSATITGNLTFSITNVPASAGVTFVLALTNGGAFTVTLPGSVTVIGGSPVLSAAGTDWLVFRTLDGGTAWTLEVVGNPRDADLATWATITPGTGVGTALGTNVGSAGAFVTNGGALGTPSSGTLTNCTFPTLNQNTSGYAEALKSATTTVTVSAANAPSSGQVLTATSSTAATWQTPSGGGSGDVVGPASAADNAIARYDTTTGKLLQNSGVTVSDVSGSSVTVASTAGNALALAATAPAATTGASVAGVATTITAGAAVASTDTAGAAAGGSVTITAGAAARLTSGNANGGNINLVTGAGIGTGVAGQVLAPSGAAAAPGYSFTSDPDTGIVNGTNSLNFVTGGATRLQVTSTAVNATVALGGNAGSAAIGGFLQTVTNRTSSSAETAAESLTVLTNAGAAALITRDLPGAGAGRTFTYIVMDADGLKIQAATGDDIRVIDKITASAGYIQSTTIGSVVTLVAVDATTWVATSIHGVWTDGTFTYDDTSLTTP